MAKKSNKKSKAPINLKAQIEKLGAEFLSREQLKHKDGLHLMTGIMPLDLILTSDIGLHSGCIEIYGPEGVGKTSLVLSLIRSCKEAGIPSMFLDAEFALTDELCEIFDIVPNEDFLLKQPDDAEDALNSAELFLRCSPKSVVVIDSIAMLLAQSEWEEKVETKSFNPVTLMLSKFAKKAPKLCKKNDSLVIYLNQIRDNLSGYGSPIRVPGPRAIKFNTKIRVEMKRVGQLKESGENGEIVGHKVEFKTHKNKFARPYQKAQSSLIYGKGFHQGYDLCELTQALGLTNLISINGSWFTFFNDQRVQGQAKAAEYIIKNPDIRKKNS
jgi:recombination protein RecA